MFQPYLPALSQQPLQKKNIIPPSPPSGGGGRYFPNCSNIYLKWSFPPFSGTSKIELFNTVQRRGSLVPEMEFLDISLTKDSWLLIHAIHSPGGFKRKPYSSLVLKILTKNPPNLSLFMIAFCWRKNEGRKPDKKSLCPDTSAKHAVQEFHFRRTGIAGRATQFSRI